MSLATIDPLLVLRDHRAFWELPQAAPQHSLLQGLPYLNRGGLPKLFGEILQYF